MSKMVKAALGLAAGLFVSSMAISAQAGTITQVIIKDGLTSSISLSGTPNVLGTVSPAFSTVAAGSSNTNVVVSPYNQIASIHFTYASGTKACKFDTSLTVLNGVPKWTKTGSSTGSTYATCEAKITAVDLYTYDYTVEFTMR